jgi:TetR/AcrR family transcriptional regulator, transcriptional repressor for nem operon
MATAARNAAGRKSAPSPPEGGAPRRPASRDAARTYEQLLDAGVEVAEREGLAGLSVNRVVAAAGVAKGTFYVHFPDRESFVDALHARFHERVREAVERATAGTDPGAERLLRGIEAYLDVCLEDRAIKALALEARTDAALTEAMSTRHERLAAASVSSLKAMGWPDPKAASLLLSAMTSETSILELEAGRRLPGARRALRRFLGVA